MPAKKSTPAPIDRPLSRAYLREFTGWSTAYPPGASDPTSLRLMENVMVNRDGSVRVRPGLRYLSYKAGGAALDDLALGSHEPFFLNDGSKAYLFAVRETDETVGFRVLANTGLGQVVQPLDAPGIDFAIPQTEAVLNFTAETTYVKYLQIDNKIFALSNAGEAMRLFYVGAEKRAKRLESIVRPEWEVDDKLTVVHPDAAWITSGVPTAVRTNHAPNPSFETNTSYWGAGASTALTRSTTVARTGDYSLRLATKPVRSNLCPYPLAAPVSSTTGWAAGSGLVSLTVVGGYLRSTIPPGAGVYGYTNSPIMGGVEAGLSYRAAYDVANFSVAEGRLYCLFRFFNTAGAVVGETEVDMPDANGRIYSPLVTAPPGAVSLQIYPKMVNVTSGSQSYDIRNVLVTPEYNDVTFFDGDSGANYYWTGTPDASSSVYAPDAVVSAYTSFMSVESALDYTASLYSRAGTTARSFTMQVEWFIAGSVSSGFSTGVVSADASGVWTRLDDSDTAPTNAIYARILYTSDVAIPFGEYHYVDSVLFEQAAALDSYFDGSVTSTSTLTYAWTGPAHGSTSTETTYAGANTIPSAETRTVNTLISSVAADNTYSFGFFYTFANEVGESAVSQVTMVRAQRGWSQWRWETANAAGEPSGTETNDPAVAADQLVAFMDTNVFTEALAQGATKWNLYMLTWGDQDPMPISAVKVASRDLTPTSLHGSAGWLRMTPEQAAASAEIARLPNLGTRYNFSNPSNGGQGIVAADRMVMVFDPTAPAVIRWSSNQQASYTDFSATKGGGYKTLTSGNMFVPACVKLWQNPQSVDTLTILCLGVDGYSTGYYMAPAEITSQSESTAVMGFEETTATPGTTSPYGVEVLNSALFHPLDEQLMKSTANNYNINHSSVTDIIQNGWRDLQFKNRIVSSQHDNRLYYLVNNPYGELLEEGCWGNEVWVLDAAKKEGSWSRWLVQGQSLRKIQQGNEIVMSLVRPDGIYYFDEGYSSDDYVVPAGGNLLTANASSMETDVSDWAAGGSVNPVLSHSTVRAFDGAESLLITWGTGGFLPLAGTDVSGLTIGELYTASAYVYVPTGSPDVLIAVGAIGVGWGTAVKGEWVRLHITFVATATTHTVQIWGSGSPVSGDQCWVDAVQVWPGVEPITFTTGATGVVVATRSIPWMLETNTQGANRAHDAWARLQQANIMLGNFQGSVEWGVRGHDINGKTVDIHKITQDSAAPTTETWDLEDMLLIRRDMKEWFFYANSIENVLGEVQPSSGQVTLVQYRYVPSTVNTGYEFGSVETFEYGRAVATGNVGQAPDGVPASYLDRGRP